jgi:alpha-1,2-mannosyltransferase
MTTAALNRIDAVAANVAAYIVRHYPLLAQFLFERNRRTLIFAAALFSAIYVGVFLVSVATAKDMQTIFGSVIGGDFIVFWSAAKELYTGDIVSLYQDDVFQARLQDLFPAPEPYGLFWLYPPTALLFIAPFGALSYLPALFAWMAINLGGFAVFLSKFWRHGVALFFAMFSLAAFQGWVTGQTGFITAILLTSAAAFAGPRPVIAGIAAGILTIKPQFGLLIPIAFAAAGCWRAFGVAALTGGTLAALSLLVFGADIWMAFFTAFSEHGARMQSEVFPIQKIISPFGAMMVLGANSSLALGVQGLMALGLAGFVFMVWRKVDDWDIRVMVLCAAAPLATPYALYYELPILIPPLFLLARRAVQTGWLRGEKLALIALWAAPLFLPGQLHIPGLPLAFIIAASAFALCARRAMSALTPMALTLKQAGAPS